MKIRNPKVDLTKLRYRNVDLTRNSRHNYKSMLNDLGVDLIKPNKK